jgi:PTS system mannose-specific IID component
MLAAAVRLFTVQGSWSYERLQGIGAAVAIEPLLRDLPGGVGGEAYRRAMGRAAKFFNTHPYLAGLALGAVAKAEHAGVDGEQIERLRSILKGPLGSVGDRLVWVGALPVASAIGVVLVALGHPLLGVLSFLGVFNTVHLGIRFWGLGTGWRLGMAVGRALSSPAFTAAMRYAGPSAALAVGFALPVAGVWLTAAFGLNDKIGVAAVVVVGAVFAKWLAPRLGAARFGLLAIVLALLGGAIWP